MAWASEEVQVIEIATSGSVVTADVEAIVNTVNTVGVMGKGVALQFKRAYPDNFQAYKRACSAGRVRLGEVLAFDRGVIGPRRWILNFPTKGHWRSSSRLADIGRGLDDLLRVIDEQEIRSIALPALGCGNGGLDWAVVEPLMRRALDRRPSVDALFFPPGGVPIAGEMPDARPTPTMTTFRAIVIAVAAAYSIPAFQERLDLTVPGVSLLELQKLTYLVQKAGAALDLPWEHALYGPYSVALDRALADIEGHFVLGMADRSAAVQKLEPIRVLDGAAQQAKDVLADHPESADAIDRVLLLVEGLESAYGLELIGTVLFTALEHHLDPDALPRAVTLVQAWSARKRRLFGAHAIEVAWERLVDQGFIPTSPAPSR